MYSCTINSKITKNFNKKCIRRKTKSEYWS